MKAGCTSENLSCVMLDILPADTTVECILDFINDTGRDLHECQKVSMLYGSQFSFFLTYLHTVPQF